MKLEIDIPSILYQDAKENRNYISLTKMEIAWKAIADGKPLEQETVSKESYDHEYFLRKELEIKIAKLQRQLEEQSRDMKEIEEVINCDTDAETKCKMISYILTAKPHYFEESQESEDV